MRRRRCHGLSTAPVDATSSALGAGCTDMSREIAPKRYVATGGRHGHLAADCPKPAACFRCGELGHWVKHCPKPSWWQPSSTLLRAPFNTETRWVLFEPPTIKEYTHFCRCCGYETSLLTKASQGMPRHKVKAGGSWCDGSGQPPLKSVLQRELPNTTIHSSQQLGTHDAILDWAAGVRDHDRIVSARAASGRYRCQ